MLHRPRGVGRGGGGGGVFSETCTSHFFENMYVILTVQDRSVQVHMNDGTIDVIRLTIRTEQDAAVLRDAESAPVLCAATCLIIEFSDGVAGSGRAAFQQLTEERCVSIASAEVEGLNAPMRVTELVAQVGDFKAACKKRMGAGSGVLESPPSTALGRKAGGHFESPQQFPVEDAPIKIQV